MIKIKNYLLQSEIGHGKYGKVYKGKNLETEEIVAIKKIQKNLLTTEISKQLLSQEISCMKFIQDAQQVTPNENVVQFVEYIESPSNHYIIMEYCNGKDLKSLLDNNGHFSESEAIQKFKELVNGLRMLVDNQIMHRDLKTANIFLQNEILKIGDFGFACQAETDTLKLGTPLYMSLKILKAPELLKCRKYDSKIDIWALGVILYQLLFGIFPFLYKFKFKFERFKADKLNQLEIYETTTPDYQYNNIQISYATQILLQKMLTLETEGRITWNELFNYRFEINTMEQSQPEPIECVNEKDNKAFEEEVQPIIPSLFLKQKILIDRNENGIKTPTDPIRQVQNCEAFSNMNSHCFSLQTSCSEMRKISQQTFDMVLQDDSDFE